eukprot:403351333
MSTFHQEHAFWQQRVGKELFSHRTSFDQRIGLSPSHVKSNYIPQQSFKSFALGQEQPPLHNLVDQELMRLTTSSTRKLCQSKQLKSRYMPRNKQIYTYGGSINMRNIFENENQRPVSGVGSLATTTQWQQQNVMASTPKSLEQFVIGNSVANINMRIGTAVGSRKSAINNFNVSSQKDDKFFYRTQQASPQYDLQDKLTKPKSKLELLVSPSHQNFNKYKKFTQLEKDLYINPKSSTFQTTSPKIVNINPFSFEQQTLKHQIISTPISRLSTSSQIHDYQQTPKSIQKRTNDIRKSVRSSQSNVRKTIAYNEQDLELQNKKDELQEKGIAQILDDQNEFQLNGLNEVQATDMNNEQATIQSIDQQRQKLASQGSVRISIRSHRTQNILETASQISSKSRVLELESQLEQEKQMRLKLQEEIEKLRQSQELQLRQKIQSSGSMRKNEVIVNQNHLQFKQVRQH